jgi:hypothetical protein
LKKKKRFELLAPDWRLLQKGKDMKNSNTMDNDDLRPEYEFDYSKGVRGKHYTRLLKEGSNIVVLEPDIAESFRDSNTVNEALRLLLKLTQSTKRLTSRRPIERVKKA